MKRWVIRWAMPAVAAILLIPFTAEAGMKTILRFEKKKETSAPEKPAAKEPPSQDATAPERASPAPTSDQGAAPDGAGRPDDRPDWYGRKFSTEDAAQVGAGLPGTPAEEETTTAPTRPVDRVRVAPSAPPRGLPIAAPSPRAASTATPIAVPAAPAVKLPTRPEPFTYAPVQPGAITPRGYDPSLAPPGQVRVPAPAPIVSGRPPVRPRPLPRLAPYGTALPPDQTEPPAAIPR